MQNIRAVIRLILFFCVASLTIIFVGMGRLLLFNRSAFYQWKNVIAKLFAAGSIKITGMKLDIEGTCPDPPFFLVTNHLSYIDILPLWYCCKGTFIAKSEISKWPFFGIGAKVLGVLFINREDNRDIRRVNELISRQIGEEQGIILFPEGTSSGGDKVLPFNPALLLYPAFEEIPVNYATILYSTDTIDKPASEYICWWGDMAFFSHFFELLKLKKFQAKIIFGNESVVHNNRKVLASVLHQKVKENFKPNA